MLSNENLRFIMFIKEFKIIAALFLDIITLMAKENSECQQKNIVAFYVLDVDESAI